MAECGLRSRGQCRAHLPRPPSAAPGILAYTSEDVDILDRRARLRSDPRGTMSRIHNLRLRQRLLRLELRDAKRRLMVPDSRWTYDRQYLSSLPLEFLSRIVYLKKKKEKKILYFHDFCSSRRGQYGLARSVVPGSARGRDVHPAEAGARVQESRPVDHLLRLLPAAIETGGNINGDPDHLT